MSERPLEVPRRDPTASQGIHAAERDARWDGRGRNGPLVMRERSPRPDPACLLAAPLTYDEAKERREALLQEILGINLALAQEHWGNYGTRAKLVERKMLVERTMAQLKKTIAQLQPPPVSNPKIAPERYEAMAEAMAAAGGTEMLYRMYRMFSFYTHRNDGMADEHRAFMGGVVGTLRAAGYDTKKPHEGDPLEGFAAEKEEAA